MSAGAVHVIGAGIAGLSAAMRLVETGRKVIVHEAASFAGGRCRSYHDPTLGLVIDNGNHLLLSGNHQALDYLDRIGARETLHDPGAAIFDFADLKSGERWRLDLSEGRIPWWLFDRKKRVPGTALGEYFAPLGVFMKGRSATVGEAMPCEGPLYERLWRPLLTSALNTDPPESSAALTAALLRETLAAGGKACHPLFAGHGLASSFVDPALAFLAARGSEVRFGDRLRAIGFEGERAVALDFDGAPQTLGVDDSVIVSVPPWIAKDLLPGLTAPDEFRGILNVHFRIAPPPGQPAILGVVNAEIEWLFAFPDRLSVTISNADRLIDRPRDELAAEIWREASAAHRSSRRPAALADRQGKARDLRRDPGAGRQTPGFAHPVGECRPRRGLDPDRPAGHHRRRGAFGL